MSGVVVEVRVKEGHEIMKGDPLCGKAPLLPWRFCVDRYSSDVLSNECNEGELFVPVEIHPDTQITDGIRCYCPGIWTYQKSACSRR